MSTPRFDPVLHPPTRLQIATVLTNVDTAEFSRLREITGVSDSVLSKHLSALVEAGYVTLSKAALDGRQRTWAAFTRSGRKAFASHVQALTDLVRHAERAAGGK